MNSKKNIPTQLNVENFCDDRGLLSFCNDFKLNNFKRFYILKNFQKNFIRAWHGHRLESKAFMIINGSFQISAVKISNWKKPSTKEKVYNFYISEQSNKIIFVPKGYANGLKSLNDNSSLIVFSSSSIKESLDDDYRFQYDYWDPWQNNYR